MIKDILIDENNVLAIVNGDFEIGNPINQNQKLLLETNKGEFKQHPITGVGASLFIDEEGNDSIIREIRKQFSEDGIKITQLNIVNEQIKIKANY